MLPTAPAACSTPWAAGPLRAALLAVVEAEAEAFEDPRRTFAAVLWPPIGQGGSQEGCSSTLYV